MIAAESTSAALRRVEEELADTKRALAASQQDLTRTATKAADVIERLWAVEGERDLARAELASVLAELRQLREATS